VWQHTLLLSICTLSVSCKISTTQNLGIGPKVEDYRFHDYKDVLAIV
jgi:hypothetical protein